MKINKNRISFRELTAVFTAMVICLLLAACGTTKTLPPESNTTKGFFRDIKDWRGAVVGTSYEQATNEINMRVTTDDNTLTAHIIFVDPHVAPYLYAEQLGIAAYRIVDANGKTVKEDAAESTEVNNGQATVNIQLDSFASGNYKLIVTAFVANEKKGVQPLNINGNWECAFTK